MISKKCIYSYYKDTAILIIEKNKINDVSTNTSFLGPYYIQCHEDKMFKWEFIKSLLNTKKITSILGYKTHLCIHIKTKITDAEWISNSTNSFLCQYTPQMIKNLFSISDGLDEIFNSIIGRKCENSEDAYISYMAKILGSSIE